eukprot:715885-Alexandrium_andersonii.AAC.1
MARALGLIAKQWLIPMLWCLTANHLVLRAVGWALPTVKSMMLCPVGALRLLHGTAGRFAPLCVP